MAGPQCPKEPARESAAGQCGSKSQAVFAAWTPCAAETWGPVAPGPDPRAEPVQLLSDCRQSNSPGGWGGVNRQLPFAAALSFRFTFSVSSP